jgi:nucleoid-associated protein EbfC
MFGDFEKMQEEMQEKLGAITVEAEAGDGAVKVTMSAKLEVENIKIDATKLDANDTEQLEDFILVAMNEAIVKAQTKAAAETQKMMQNILPGGLGSLGGLFGK